MMESILVCKRVRFYSRKDEDVFFEWIKKIECIDTFDGAGDELYLYISSNDLHDNDLRDLIALFYRYKIKNMQQLKKYKNDSNKKWFYENKRSYWHKKIFGDTVTSQ